MTTFTEPKPAGMPTWLDLVAPDAEAARAFYQAVFGWEYDVGAPEFGGYATARLGDRSVAGVVGNQPDAPAMPAAWGLYFATNDIEADLAKALSLGAQVLYPTMAVGDFGSMATCADPQGAAFSFWQAGSHIGTQVVNEPGAAAWHELYTSNAQAARDFYSALLGASADPMPGGMEYYVLKQGDWMFSGIMQIDPSWGGMQPQWVTYFAVANADETVARVVASGGKIMGTIDDSPFGRIAALADPQGAVFKIVETPAA
jgi:predicted enzyme related to lactoylglutathione lyase